MSRFIGTPARHEVPAGYYIRRHLASATYSWLAIDFRDPAWMGASPVLGAPAAAEARGEVLRIDVRLVAGTVIKVADEPTPGDRWSSADATSRVVRCDYRNSHGRHVVYLDSGGGAVELEVEVWFDVPLATDVIS